MPPLLCSRDLGRGAGPHRHRAQPPQPRARAPHQRPQEAGHEDVPRRVPGDDHDPDGDPDRDLQPGHAPRPRERLHREAAPPLRLRGAAPQREPRAVRGRQVHGPRRGGHCQ